MDIEPEARALIAGAVGATGWALAIGLVLGLWLNKDPRDKPNKSEGKE